MLDLLNAICYNNLSINLGQGGCMSLEEIVTTIEIYVIVAALLFVVFALLYLVMGFIVASWAVQCGRRRDTPDPHQPKEIINPAEKHFFMTIIFWPFTVFIEFWLFIGVCLDEWVKYIRPNKKKEKS